MNYRPALRFAAIAACALLGTFLAMVIVIACNAWIHGEVANVYPF